MNKIKRMKGKQLLNRNNILHVTFIMELISAVMTDIYVIVTKPIQMYDNAFIKDIPFDGNAVFAILVFSFLCIVASFLLVVMIVVRKKSKYDYYSVFYLMMYMIISAVWMFIESKVPTLMCDNPLANNLLSCFSFNLMPIPFILFVRNICNHGKNIFNLLAVAFMLNYAGNYIWIITHQFNFPQTLFIIHILIGIVVAVCLYICFIELFKYKNRDVSEILIGMVVYIIIVLICIMRYYIVSDSDYIGPLIFGLIVFISSMAFGTIRRIIWNVTKAKTFASIASSIPSGIFLAKNDSKLTLLYANDFFYKLYGYNSPEEAKENCFTYAMMMLSNSDEENNFFECRIGQIKKGIYQSEFETNEKDRYGKGMWILTQMEYQPQTDEITGTIIDITQRRNIEEQLRISEEEYIVVSKRISQVICRYDVAENKLTMPESYAKRYNCPIIAYNVPGTIINTGVIAEKSVMVYMEFYKNINEGKKNGNMVMQTDELDGTIKWWKMSFDTIFDAMNKPKRAVIICEDITDLREKEIAYAKWKQDIVSISKEKADLFEWNLTRDILENESGESFEFFKDFSNLSFDERTKAYAESKVCSLDRQAYITLLNRNHLIKAFNSGDTSHEMEFRKICYDGTGDDFKWMYLNIQLVSYPVTGDIKIYMITRDIDIEKRQNADVELRAREDSLTGLLNRNVFKDEISKLLININGMIQCAFIMIDIDGFKKVNDTFGHIEGDTLLKKIAYLLCSAQKDGDIVGRLGGDEFAMCLVNIASSADLDYRISSICESLCININGIMTISGSLGVAMFPGDGVSFDELYRKSDIALYEAKKHGRNRFEFYTQSMEHSAYIASVTPIDIDN